MLSYQHAYHAGNLADIHKHEWLAKILSTLVQKDKPLTYLETHSGRGLYDLTATEAEKTGEAKAGILSTNTTQLHPTYQRVIADVKANYGENHYPGSPMIAKNLLRKSDKIHLAELHPQEFKHLEIAMKGDRRVKCHHQDGFKMADALCPPTPRRGMIVIDPSYEIKKEYEDIPQQIAKIHHKWNVGIIALWYPILPSGAHIPMIETLRNANYPKFHVDEVMFDTGLSNHRLKGAGMAFINMPWLG